jgi:hypothetical protein
MVVSRRQPTLRIKVVGFGAHFPRRVFTDPGLTLSRLAVGFARLIGLDSPVATYFVESTIGATGFGLPSAFVRSFAVRTARSQALQAGVELSV